MRETYPTPLLPASSQLARCPSARRDGCWARSGTTRARIQIREFRVISHVAPQAARCLLVRCAQIRTSSDRTFPIEGLNGCTLFRQGLRLPTPRLHRYRLAEDCSDSLPIMKPWFKTLGMSECSVLPLNPVTPLTGELHASSVCLTSLSHASPFFCLPALPLFRRALGGVCSALTSQGPARPGNLPRRVVALCCGMRRRHSMVSLLVLCLEVQDPSGTI